MIYLLAYIFIGLIALGIIAYFWPSYEDSDTSSDVSLVIVFLLLWPILTFILLAVEWHNMCNERGKNRSNKKKD